MFEAGVFFRLALLPIIGSCGWSRLVFERQQQERKTDWIEGRVQHFSLLWSPRHPKSQLVEENCTNFTFLHEWWLAHFRMGRSCETATAPSSHHYKVTIYRVSVHTHPIPHQVVPYSCSRWCVSGKSDFLPTALPEVLVWLQGAEKGRFLSPWPLSLRMSPLWVEVETTNGCESLPWTKLLSLSHYADKWLSSHQRLTAPLLFIFFFGDFALVFGFVI